MKKFLAFLPFFYTSLISAQVSDTTKVTALPMVTIAGSAAPSSIGRLEPIAGTYIFDGKKNEVISLTHSDVNITDKTGRQIFAKVPGVFVYDMDGAGNQVNIATRGLDPHRGWEFNIRKDGILTNSDMYAYPASHYSIPMESVERIEIVRGTGSLQYGAQFGGMLNYISKEGDPSRAASFENYTTIGSFNLLSTYNALGGKIGRFKYYAYMAKKSRDGFRQNEHTDYGAEGVRVEYEAHKNLVFRVEWARSKYLYRIPGPLSDAMFAADPTQATRSRNYFSPTIHIPAFTAKWSIAAHTQLQWVSSAVLGSRNSVLFDKPTTIADTIVTATRAYNNRQVDIDQFNSLTNEIRLLQQYPLGKQQSALVAGVQWMNNNLHRTQLGKGTTGSDYDLTLVDPVWGRDIRFKTQNVALFAENNFVISNRLTANIGARIEMGESKMTGTIVYYPDNKVPLNIKHHFPLLGGGMRYKATRLIDIYGGCSQAYRPMIFKDIVPGSTFEKVDENIKDADGYNLELGTRGGWKNIKWDITGFLLRYNNRFGTVALTDELGNFYTLRTNIGHSITKGLEVFVQGIWNMNRFTQFTVFTSTSLMDGRYISGSLKQGNNNIDIAGNKIESVPNVISRNGLTIKYRKMSLTALYSYTSDSYADAFNTTTLSATGAVGVVPAYGILDVNTSIRISEKIQIKASLNNALNQNYFTKRPLFYPGPGIWPSDGRNGTVSVVWQIGTTEKL